MADVTFTIHIRDDGTPVIREIKREAATLGSELETAGKRASQGLGGLSSVLGILKGAVGGLAFGVLAKEAISLADTAKQLEGRLKLVTSSSQELAQVQGQLFTVAQQTRTSLEGTVGLYASLVSSTKGLGVSQQALVAVTKQLNQLTALSGASAEASGRALFQLSQSFRGGTLRAEEFNSIIDQAPEILETMARGMGLSMGQFRARVVDGGIAVNELLAALQKMETETQERFSRLSPTVGQAMVMVGNSVLRAVGKLDEMSGASGVLSGALASLSVVIDDLVQDDSIRRWAAQTQSDFRAVYQSITDIIDIVPLLQSALQRLISGPAQIAAAIDQGAQSFARFDQWLTEFLNLAPNMEQRAKNVAQLFKDAKPAAPEETIAAFRRLQGEIVKTGDAAQAAGGKIKTGLTAPNQEAEKEAGKLVERLKEHAGTLNLSGAALANYVAQQYLAKGASKETAEQVRQAVLADEQAKAAKEASADASREGAAADREAASAAKQRAQAQSEMAAEIAVLQQVVAGTITLEQAQRNLAIAELAAKNGSVEQSTELIRLRDASQQARTEVKQLAEAIQRGAELTRTVAQTEQAALDSRAAALENSLSLKRQELQFLEESGAPISQQLAVLQQIGEEEARLAAVRLDRAKANLILAQSELAFAEAARDNLQQQIAQETTLGQVRNETMDAYLSASGRVIQAQGTLAKAGDDVAAAQTNITLTTRESAQELKKLNSIKFDFGDTIIENFEQVLIGIRQGTRKIGDIISGLEDTVVTTFIHMFAQTIKEKLQWEVTLSQNLLNDLPALFSAGGNAAGQGFISSLFSWLDGAGAQIGTDFAQKGLDAAKVTWQSGDIFDSGAGTGALANGKLAQSAVQGGSAWGTLFGTVAAGVAGNTFGSMFSQAVGLNSKNAKKGGNVGGTVGGITGAIGAAMLGLPPQLGAAIGSFFGNILGSFFGSLFDHIPTKGTQIRKAVDKWLTEIGVSFAGQIQRGKYFFEETKALAEEMLGGDFLAASKKILRDNVGPELAAELQALGVFLTADQAKKLGKPTEQSATTFGNLITANLGKDSKVLTDAIDEIVKKGGISFEALTDKITSVFKDGAISAEFYKESILGAVSIFSRDLPAAIGVSKIAMQSFGEDGIFSLEKFQEKLLASTKLYDAVGKAAYDALTSPLSDKEVFADFDKNIKDIERDLLTNKFWEDFKPKLYEGIDTSDGLDDIEKGLLHDRLVQGRKDLEELLAGAGLLPDAFDAAAESAQKVGDAIESAILSPLSDADALKDFSKSLDDIERDLISREFLKGKKEELLAGVNFDDGISPEERDFLRNGIAKARNDLDELYAEAGLLPEKFAEIGKSFTAAFDLETIKSGIDSILGERATIQARMREIEEKYGTPKNIRLGKAGAEYAKLANDLKDINLGEELGTSIADNIAKGFEAGLNNLIITTILGPKLAQAQAEIQAAWDAARADGTITAQEQADIANLSSKWAGDLKSAAKDLEPALNGVSDASAKISEGSTVSAADFQDIKLSTGDTKNNLNEASVATKELAGHTKDISEALNNLDVTKPTEDLAKFKTETEGVVGKLNAASGEMQKMSAQTGEAATSMQLLQEEAGAIKSHMENATKALQGGELPMRNLDDLAFAMKLKFEESKAAIDQTSLSPVVTEAERIRDALIAGAQAISNARIPPQAHAQGFASGGPVRSGRGGVDDVPALLMRDEFVVNANDAPRNAGILEFINKGGTVRHFATGGFGSNPREGYEGLGIGESPGSTDPYQILRRILLVLNEGRLPQNTDSLKDVVAAVRELKRVDTANKGDVNYEKRYQKLVLAQLDALTKQLEEKLKAILDPIKAFIGESADPVASVREQFETLKKSLLENREALEKSGVDVDDYLARLASALPERIREAVEAANQATVSALESIKSARDRILGGAGANPFEEEAGRAAQIAELQAKFATATGDEKATIGQKLTDLLAQQVERSGLDKFGLDFGDLRTRNLGLIAEIEKALQKQLDDAYKKAGLPPPKKGDPPLPPNPNPTLKKPGDPTTKKVEDGQLHLQVNLTVPITPGVEINGKVLWDTIHREAGKDFENGVDELVNKGKVHSSILRIGSPR